MKLLYHGTLDPQTSEYVMGMLREYPCVVEVHNITRQFWDKFHKWSEANMPKHTITINSGSSGEDYNTDRVLYGVVGKSSGDAEAFMFFKSAYEKQIFINEFDLIKRGGYVANTEPFQTVLEAR